MDLINAKKVREFIKETGRERKQTIIITSHNMSDIEQVCDRIVIINRGKIVFDGSLRDLRRRDGANKRVKVIFNGPWAVGEVEKLGKILERNGQELLLEVEPERVTSVASYLFSNFPVQDINIAGPSLEKIIESIFQERTSE
jgi:ABC-2 type transport system ATP-binding protein